MISQIEHVLFFVLVLNAEVRANMLNLLKKREYPSVEIAGLDDLLKLLKEKSTAIVLMDSEAVLAYGAGAVSKVRMACRECRLIFLCSQLNRDLVRQAMGLGAYGCIIEPYAEWELLTMIRPILLDFQLDQKGKPGKSKRQGKKTQTT